MASTVIMIGTNGPDPACQDGDPLEFFNDRRTLIDFAQRIVQPANKQELKNFSPNGPHKNLLERVSQYKFEHISKDVIKRTKIATGKSVDHTYPTFDIKLNNYAQKRYVKNIDMETLVSKYLFDVKADIAGFKVFQSGLQTLILDKEGKTTSYGLVLIHKEYSHVKEDIASKLASKLPVFGSIGKEVWYGGRIDYSMPTVQLCWDDIEQDFPDKKRVDHIYMDYSAVVKKRFLCLPTVDVDDDTANNIVATVVDNTNPKKLIIIKKRACTCDIDALGLTNAKTTDIRDLTKIIDILESETDMVHSNIISLKA